MTSTIAAAARQMAGCAMLFLCQWCNALTGTVIDVESHAPIAQATVIVGRGIVGRGIVGHDIVRRTDDDGHFDYAGGEQIIGARAVGYRAVDHEFIDRVARANAGPDLPVVIALAPLRVKAVYLSFYGIGDTTKRTAALRLIQESELNALVIDFKGDRGALPYVPTQPSNVELPAPAHPTVHDMPALISGLKARGIYLIARIVVFKDDRLARNHPELAVKTSAGEPWRDREGLAWVDPFRSEVWDYNIAIAEAAANLGFDEIQFDYVRFPDATRSPVFSAANTNASRLRAISGFLRAAQEKLSPHNVFVSADVFGYVCWNENDTGIGQHLADVTNSVDYVSPMLYPSGFTWGIPGQRDPVVAPAKIVGQSLARAIRRTGQSSLRFRPWLQGFRDYAFDHRAFGAYEIRQQIDAAEAAGASGWMLWNSRNIYSTDGLKDEAGNPLLPSR